MIRKVQISDAEAIANIYKHFVLDTTISFETKAPTFDEMARRIEHISSTYPYFVYEDEGEVVGYCYAHRWKDREAYSATCETTIYLAETVQGKGIGRKLMLHLIDECRKQGFHALVACITSENRASLQFHETLGFERVSEFRQVGRKFNRWLDVADLELLL